MTDWYRDGYPECLFTIMADHLGAPGVARIFASIGICSPPTEWKQAAAARFPFSALGDVTRSRTLPDMAQPLPRRVYGYAEWMFCDGNLGEANYISGSRLRENGQFGGRAWRHTWLRASRLPNNPHIDHNWCAEFALLCEACEAAISAGFARSLEDAASVSGRLRLLVSTTPCLSCTCAFQQFRLCFPKVTIEFAQLRPWAVPGTYGGAPSTKAMAASDEL